MSTTPTNPLKRLHNILSEISNSTSTNPYIALSRIFNLSSDDKASIIASYSEIYKLCEDSRELITKLPVNHDKLSSPINDAILCLSKIDFNDSSTGMISLKNSLSDKILSNLDLCSEMLLISLSEKDVEDSELKELSNDLSSLIDSIMESSITIDLKNILIQHLNSMNTYITKYKLYGSYGLKNELNNTVGDIVINKHLVKNQDDKSAIEKVLGLMSKINTLISFNTNLPTIISSITGFLNQ